MLFDRAERPGGLTAAEAAHGRRGVRALAERPAEARTGPLVGLRRALAEADSRQRALARLHHSMIRGGVEVCAHCSGWDEVRQRCRGLVTPWPCPTAEAAGLDRLTSKESAA